MKPASLFAIVLALGLYATPLPTADAFGPERPVWQDTANARWQSEMQRFAGLSDGTVGVAVHNLSTGQTLSFNGDTLFPMASTYKVAVAGKIFSMIDAGAISLQQVVTVDRALMSSGGIADLLPHSGAALSVYNLLDLMLTRSDNSATDVLVALAGGAGAVNDWVKAAGVQGLRVDSNTAQLLYRAMGINPPSGAFQANVNAALAADPALRERDAHDMPNMAFASDPRDSTTPRAMADLLVALRTGKLLTPQSTSIFLSIMERCRTGAKRLAGMLPPGATVAHKTGSLNGLGADVGLVTMPDGQIFAISVYVMKDYKGHEARDQVMAHAARAAYDYFLFSAGHAGA